VQVVLEWMPISSESPVAGLGQILAHNAVFSVFCNWFIFSMFSALGREDPEAFPFVISKFSALGDSANGR
jgi:hypothetical protein